MNIYIIEKIKKINGEKLEVGLKKNVGQNLKKISSRHNPMAEMCRALFKYENEREIG